MNRKLVKLAKLYGVQTSYRDMSGKKRDASPESLLLVLGALGARVKKMDDVATAVRERKEELKRPLEPVIVAWDGQLKAAGLPRVGKARVSLVNEEGIDLPWPPERLATGYYTLHFPAGGRMTSSLVISAPTKAYFPFDGPTWGIFSPVYALHSKRSRAVGDLTDLKSIVSWMRGLGGRVAATLPLLAGFLDEPFEPSPYLPVSRIFWNELYADPETIPEFASCNEAQGKWASRPRAARWIDYRAAMAHRRSVFEALAISFFKTGEPPRRDAFEAFRRANPDLDDYARFRAVTDRQRKGWTAWQPRMRDGDIQGPDYEEAAWQYHAYAQWVVQEQLERLAHETKDAGAALYLDLPIGLNSRGYDAWRYRDYFVKGMAGGAPPDKMFTTGQNWGFAPAHPQAMRNNRHAYTISYIRNHLKYAGLLRIDHVMGLHRFFWIPEGLSGDKGVYVEYPAEELYAILSVESHRNRAGIVGENLGIVPPQVNSSMRRHNVLQMYVAQYEIIGISKDGKLNRPPVNSVASLNTHDMPPFRAFLEGTDISARLDLGLLMKKDVRIEEKKRTALRKSLKRFLLRKRLLKTKSAAPEDVFHASVKFLGQSPAKVVLMNIEDLWQEVEPQNIPATSTQRPNWRRRLRRSVEQIRKDKRAEMELRDLNKSRGAAD